MELGRRAEAESTGLHWVLVLVEGMIAEWHIPPREAIFSFPLKAATALWPALLQRHGVDPGLLGPDLARQHAREKALKWVHANYNVLPPLPTPGYTSATPKTVKRPMRKDTRRADTRPKT